jgi:hypothetical protein
MAIKHPSCFGRQNQIQLFALVSLLATPLIACERVSPEAHAIVVSTVFDLLPAPIRENLKPNSADIAQTARQYDSGPHPSVAPMSNLPGSPKNMRDVEERAQSESDRDHFVMLDARRGTRGDAATRFPRDPDAAVAMFRSLGLPDGGRLPWAIEQKHDDLTTAWRDGDDERAARLAGQIIHLATDAAMPFSTTIDTHGVREGNLHWTETSIAESARCQTPALRLQVMFMEMARPRLSYEVRVVTERLVPLMDRRGAIFHTLFETHRCLPDLLARERAITQSLLITVRCFLK